MLKKSTYWIMVCFALIAPFLLVSHPISNGYEAQRLLRTVSDFLYVTFTQDDLVREGTAGLAIIDIDQETIQSLGWPIARTQYIKFFDKLERAGRPVVLNYLRFQENERAGAERSLDLELSRAMQRYGNIVSSGIDLDQSSQTNLTAKQHDLVVHKAIATKDSLSDVDLPRLPIQIIEGLSFIDASVSLGFGARLGGQRVVICPEVAVAPAVDTGHFVFLSSVLQFVALVDLRDIVTPSGAQRSINGKKWTIAYSYCMRHNGLTTAQYLRRRDVQVFSFKDVLEGVPLPPLKGVILGHRDLRKVQGPGPNSSNDAAIALEHHLMTRMIDGLLTNDFVSRSSYASPTSGTVIPWIICFTVLLMSCFLSVRVIALVMFLCFIAANGFSAWGVIVKGQYTIYSDIILATGLSFLLLSGSALYVSLAAAIWRQRFRASNQRHLSPCSDSKMLEQNAEESLKEAVGASHLKIVNIYSDLYEAATSPELAMTWIAKGGDPSSYERALTSKLNTTVVRRRLWQYVIDTFSSRSVVYKRELSCPRGVLGYVDLTVKVNTFEVQWLDVMLDDLSVDLEMHWNRLDLEVRSRIRDYKSLVEGVRSSILSKFLPKSLVGRFKRDQMMEVELKRMLTPTMINASLLQADIRGFSGLSKFYNELDTVKLLQSYFDSVVDKAQIFAQVKLVGDCIFLFVEYAADEQGSSTDKVLEVAVDLSKNTRLRNRQRPDGANIPLHFGTAIHFGRAVVGNLSSDECIDYTVIGSQVNLTARLEELTKTPAIKSIVGEDGIIASVDAFQSMIRGKKFPWKEIDLLSVDTRVRSFPEIDKILYLTADDLSTV